MPSFSNGWLKYGDDTGLVFRHSLKHRINTADLWDGEVVPFSTVNRRTESGTTTDYPTHDAEFGMIALSSADGSTSVGYQLQSPSSGTAIDLGGQLTIEVQSNWATSDPTDFSFGGSLTNTATLVALTGSSTGSIRVQRATNGVISPQPGSGGAGGGIDIKATISGSNPLRSSWRRNHALGGTAINPQVSSSGKGGYLTVNLGWRGSLYNGAEIVVAVDGLIIGTLSISTQAGTSFLSYLGIGGRIHNGNISANTSTKDSYIRNLQISNVIPQWAFPPKLNHIIVFGDSTTDPYDITNTSYHDSSWLMSMKRYLESRGIMESGVTITEASGYAIGDATTSLSTIISHLDYDNPTVVVINGGVNDAINGATYTGSVATSNLEDYIERAMFTSGNPATGRTSCRHVILMTPFPYDGTLTDTTKASVYNDVVSRIKAMPAWWNSTYGATWGNNRVSVIDKFGLVPNGHSWFASGANEWTGDGTHPNVSGSRVMGEALGAELVRICGLPW